MADTTQPALPPGWVWTTIGNVTNNHDGRRVPVKAEDRQSRQGPYPYYGASGIIDYVDAYLFDGDYLLIAEDGANLLSRSTPIAFQAKGKFWVNNHAHVVSTRCGACLGFLENYLNSVDLKFSITGSAQPKLTQANLNRIPVPLAPLIEQHCVVAKIEELFTELDAGVAALKRAQAKLRRYKASVLKAACEGRLVPQDPSDEPADVLLQRILAERRTKWEADLRAKGKDPAKTKYVEPAPPEARDLPGLPDGWVWATVEQVAEMIQYGTSDKADAESSEVPVLRMGNIQDGHIDFTNLKYIKRTANGIAQTILESGDLLFNRTNSAELVGKSAVFKGFTTEVAFASYLIRVRVNSICLPTYLAYFINSSFGRRYVASVVSQQVGQANVNGTKLAQMQFPLPPLAEQQRIVAEVERRLSVAAAAEVTLKASLTRAKRLRQAMLRRAFDGQLVPQDPNDEPASALLEKIRIERDPQFEILSTSQPPAIKSRRNISV